MQHLQKQPHSRIHLNLLQQSRSRHITILSLKRHRLHFEVPKQPHQHTYELDLRELSPWTAARPARPADEGTIACGRLFQVLHRM